MLLIFSSCQTAPLTVPCMNVKSVRNHSLQAWYKTSRTGQWLCQWN